MESVPTATPQQPRGKASLALAAVLALLLVLGIGAGIMWFSPLKSKGPPTPAPSPAPLPSPSPSPREERPLAETYSLKVESLRQEVEDVDGDGKYDFFTFHITLNQQLPGESVKNFWDNFYVSTAVGNCPPAPIQRQLTTCVSTGYGEVQIDENLKQLRLRVPGLQLWAKKMDGPYFLRQLVIGRNYHVMPSDTVAVEIPGPRVYRYEQFSDGRSAGPWVGGQAPTPIPAEDLYAFADPFDEIGGGFLIDRNFPHDLYYPGATGLISAQTLRLCYGLKEGPCNTPERYGWVIPGPMFHTPLYRLKFSHDRTAAEVLSYFDTMVERANDWIARVPTRRLYILNSDEVSPNLRVISAKQRFRIGPKIVVKDVAIWAGDEWLEMYFFDNWE